MAGVKGRSGGKRPGAGRKPKPPTVLTAAPKSKPAKPGKSAAAAAPVAPVALAGIGQEGFDPRPALEQIALGLLDVSPLQYKALAALLPYVHVKKGEGGKKDAKVEAAQKASGGRFAAAKPPLKLVGGR